ncbi:MAG: O-antigen ligase family protein [Candidatus Omnitrophica bacterium]|nr:O-antigen ligase family protein [Candidatus Omnitrophota bacterium]
MSNPLTTSPLSVWTSRPDRLAAGVGVLILIAVFFVLNSPLLFIGLMLGIIGAVALWAGFEYIPLVVFLQVAFSIEMQITETTRLTVPTELLIPLLFLAFGIIVLIQGKITYRPSPLNAAVIVLYVMMIVSWRYSLAPVSTLKAIIRDTGYIVAGYYLIPLYIRSERQLRHLLFGCLGVHTLLVFYGFFTQLLGGFHIYGDVAQPFFIEHCIYAAFITISFAFILAYYLSLEAGPLRFLLGVLTVIFGAAIILTFVRAAWISVFFLLLFYLFQFRYKKSSVDLIVMLIVVLLLGIVVVITTDIGGMILDRLDSITDTKYTANLDRIDRWKIALQIWGDHPYLGVGWGAYPDLYFVYAPYSQFFFDAFFNVIPYSAYLRMGAHNIYLELLAEVGLIGLMIYLLLIYVFFRRAIFLQHKIQNPLYRTFLIGAQGAMITYLIHAFVNNLGPSDKISLTFWFILGMIPTLEALHRAEEKKNADHPPLPSTSQ